VRTCIPRSCKEDSTDQDLRLQNAELIKQLGSAAARDLGPPHLAQLDRAQFQGQTRFWNKPPSSTDWKGLQGGNYAFLEDASGRFVGVDAKNDITDHFRHAFEELDRIGLLRDRNDQLPKFGKIGSHALTLLINSAEKNYDYLRLCSHGWKSREVGGVVYSEWTRKAVKKDIGSTALIKQDGDTIPEGEAQLTSPSASPIPPPAPRPRLSATRVSSGLHPTSAVLSRAIPPSSLAPFSDSPPPPRPASRADTTTNLCQTRSTVSVNGSSSGLGFLLGANASNVAEPRPSTITCRNTEAQRHSSEGSLSERRECEMCKAVYESTSSNLTRYSRYRGCIYSPEESVAEDESRRCDMVR